MKNNDTMEKSVSFALKVREKAVAAVESVPLKALKELAVDMVWYVAVRGLLVSKGIEVEAELAQIADVAEAFLSGADLHLNVQEGEAGHE